jgi:hypothetical protein
MDPDHSTKPQQPLNDHAPQPLGMDFEYSEKPGEKAPEAPRDTQKYSHLDPQDDVVTAPPHENQEVLKQESTVEEIAAQPGSVQPADDGIQSNPIYTPEELEALKKALSIDLNEVLKLSSPGQTILKQFQESLLGVMGENHSYVAKRLENVESREAIQALNRYISDADRGKAAVESTLRQLGNEEKAKQSSWSWVTTHIADGQTLQALVATALAMIFKEIAWYFPRIISVLGALPQDIDGLAMSFVKSGLATNQTLTSSLVENWLAANRTLVETAGYQMQGYSPQATGKLGEIFAERWITANLLAAVLEYSATVWGQTLWKNKGYSMNTWLGIAQGFDIIAALVALKLTGSEIGLTEVLSLGSSVLAVAVTTGMLNGIATKAGDYARNLFHSREPHENHDGVQQEPVELGPVDIEVAQIPLPDARDARRHATNIGHFLNAFPEIEWVAQREQLRDLYKCIESVLEDGEKLKNHMGPAPAAEQAAGSNSENLNILRDYRDALKKVLMIQEEVVQDTGRAIIEMDKVTQLIQEMESINEDMEKAAGRNYSKIAFYTGMGTTYFGGAFLGNIGPLIKVPGLENLNVRATINALASVPAQTLANLGHLKRKEKPGTSKTTRFIKSQAIAAPLTPPEFLLMQWGFVLSDLGKALAGKTRTAPAQSYPALPEIRSMQEFLRLLISVLFTKYALGYELKPQHAVGLGINGAGTLAGALLSRFRSETSVPQHAVGIRL